ncbi:MAG: glycosyltransferase family 4 protein [Candidatus Zixiibacteriota bacterium]|nr:MAG: glycosyltransferase family 4 protein [candidate division Zixibacteria bacterium]
MQTPEITVDIRMQQSSGIGTYISNLLPVIITSRKDLKFNLLCSPKKMENCDWSRLENVSLIECTSPIYSASEQHELWRKTPGSTDLFWSPHFNIPLFYRGKLVVTVHDLFHIAMNGHLSDIHRRVYARLLFGAIRRKAARVICVSEFTAAELARLVGINSNRTHVIHNGVDISWSDVRKGARPHPKPYLLYVGNVKPHKNLFNLVRAFAGILTEIPHDLVIVGKKEGFITGDHTVSELAANYPDRIFFTGFVEKERLQQYIVHADAFILPSFYEGFGLPPLEAMACGCPCVVSNAASLPEVCGDAALYCDPYDVEDIASKISRILSDEQLRQDLINRGRERVKLFSWDKSAGAIMDVISEALTP